MSQTKTQLVGTVVGGAVFTGVVTATSFSGNGSGLTGVGVGIATAGGTVGTGATIIDFRGPGISTITVSSGIATVNITGGGSGSGVSTSGITTGFIWSNPNLINESVDLTQPDHNYAMIGPISVAVGATVTVGVGNTFTII